MKPGRNWIIALLCAGLGPVLWAGQPGAGLSSPAREAGALIGVEDVLDRVQRYSRLTPENVEMWLEGLQHMRHPLAELELALLEIYGPEPARDPVSGIERLSLLAENPGGALTPDGARLLNVLAGHATRQIELERQVDTLASRLERERRAHLATLEKLEALRQIERELESQQQETTAPAEDD